MAEKNEMKGLLVFAGCLLGWNYVIAPLLEAVNLKLTPEEKAAADSIKNGGGSGKPIESNPWNRNYVTYLSTHSPVSGATLLLLNTATLNALTAAIYDAKGFYNDNEPALYGAFRQMKSKSQLSQLAGHFYNLKKRDLYQYVVSFLNTEELAVVTDIVNQMKKGYIKNGVLS